MVEQVLNSDMNEPDGGSPGGARGRAMATRAPAPADFVPGWLVNLAALGWRVIAVTALVAVALYACAVLWTVTASIAVAVVISAVLAPFVLRLRARGRSRTAAAGIVWAAAFLTIGTILLLLALAFLPYAVEVVSAITTGVSTLDARLADAQIPPFVASAVRDAIDGVRSSGGGVTGGLIASAAEAVTIGILATFLVFFFLRDGDKAWLWAFQALGDEKRDRITAAGDDALARVGGYLRGTTVLASLIAVTDYAFMIILGVPLALPLAVLAFLTGFIPYFGGLVTTAIILLITLGALGIGPVVVLLVLIGVRNLILGYGVRPALYGRTVRIHPALVLIALIAGFEVAGVIGLFAAVPVTAILLAVGAATVAIVDPDPRPPLPGLVPAWLDRVAQGSWRLLVVLALVALAVAISAAIPLVTVPVVLALVVAATLQPLVAWLIARGHTRTRASAIAVGGGFLAITAILVLTMASLVDQAESIALGAESGARSVSESAGGHLGLPVDAVASGARHALALIIELGASAATAFLVIILSTLFAFYLLRDGGRLWARVIGRVPSEALSEVDAAGTRAAEVLGGYMFGTAVISLVGAASQLVIMVVLGIPLALPVFVLSFLLCFIPYIGGFISTGIAFLLTVAFGSPADILVMGIWTIAFNLVTGNIVAPLVYGRTVHLHPAIVLIAIPAGAAIAGMLGMFLVVPVLGVVAATWRTVLAILSPRGQPQALEPERHPALGGEAAEPAPA